jgi:lycopene beta-cyclase
MSAPAFDAVIAGGGLSGLSLAAHLASQGWGDRSVLLVDDHHAHPTAVAWGFWSAGPGLLDAAVGRSFDRVRIHAAGATRDLRLDRYRYRVVRRTELDRVVRERLAPCAGFQFRSGRVQEIRDEGDRASVIVDGESIACRWAFDSVSGPDHAGPVDARLAFTGWEVRADRPVFDPAIPVLFDFRTPQRDGSRFLYVLPDGPDRALVELTEFVPRGARPPNAADRRGALARYLSDVVGLDDPHIVRAESAVLPLRTRPGPRRAGTVLAIGATGGLVKASTGYAFQRIQRDSAAIAASLVRHGHPFALPELRSRYRLLDAVLLDVLQRDPAQLELAFAALFRANPAWRVLAFLDETTNVRDDLRIMASLRPWPYLRALIRRLAMGPAGSGPMALRGRADRVQAQDG